MEEGDIANIIVKDLGLTLAPKMCPDQSQAFKEANNSQGSTVGRKNIEMGVSIHFACKHERGQFESSHRLHVLGRPALFTFSTTKCQSREIYVV